VRTRHVYLLDRAGEDGQSLVETALALPILVLVGAVVVELTRLFAIAAIVQVAAHQTARSYSVTSAAAENQDKPREPGAQAHNTAIEILRVIGAEPENVKLVSRGMPDFPRNGVHSIRVTVTYFTKSWFPFLSRSLGERRADGGCWIPLRGRSVARVEFGNPPGDVGEE